MASGIRIKGGVMQLEALVFDAYGTLFDVHSLTAQCETYWPGRGADISQLWRSKQLEYSWLRTLMGCYEDFDSITRDALLYAADYLRLPYEVEQVTSLMKGYGRLTPFQEVPSVLDGLADYKKAILSNGTKAMLEEVVLNNGFGHSFSAILSVESLRLFKPLAEVYQMAVDALAVPVERIGFVSSNCWDACGAQHFGFTSYWVNRGNAPVDELAARPAHVLANLSELPGLLES